MSQSTPPQPRGPLTEPRPFNGHRDRRTGRRRLPPISVLPTLCTLGNLIAGFAALFYAAKPPGYVGPYQWSGLTMAGALVFLGMVLDAIDARNGIQKWKMGTQLP